MKRVTADASVIVKWLLPEQHGETHADNAMALFMRVMEGSVELIQPPHWLAEVGAVLARLAPKAAPAHVADLVSMEIAVADSPEVYGTALDMAIGLNHRLFDTLYHAAAVHTRDAVLVTADERYFRKAKGLGNIRRLADLHEYR